MQLFSLLAWSKPRWRMCWGGLPLPPPPLPTLACISYVPRWRTPGRMDGWTRRAGDTGEREEYRAIKCGSHLDSAMLQGIVLFKSCKIWCYFLCGWQRICGGFLGRNQHIIHFFPIIWLQFPQLLANPTISLNIPPHYINILAVSLHFPYSKSNVFSPVPHFVNTETTVSEMAMVGVCGENQDIHFELQISLCHLCTSGSYVEKIWAWAKCWEKMYKNQQSFLPSFPLFPAHDLYRERLGANRRRKETDDS